MLKVHYLGKGGHFGKIPWGRGQEFAQGGGDIILPALCRTYMGQVGLYPPPSPPPPEQNRDPFPKESFQNDPLF